MSNFDPLDHFNAFQDNEAIYDLATRCVDEFKRSTLYSDLLAVEVGCWAGGSTLLLASAGFRVFAIDHWLGNPDPGEPVALTQQGIPPQVVFQTFCRNMGDRLFRSVIPLCGRSLEWAAAFQEAKLKVDLCFIDASHTYEGARDDIAEWLPVVRPGGYLLCHDYQETFPGVMKAVDELLTPFQVAGFSVAWKVKE